MKLSDGKFLLKTTGNEGKATFILEKSSKGICKLNAESQDNIMKGNYDFELVETFNYNITVCIKE